MNRCWTRIKALEFANPWFLRVCIHNNARRILSSLAWLLAVDQVDRKSLRVTQSQQMSSTRRL